KLFMSEELTIPANLMLDVDEVDTIYTYAIKHNRIIIMNDKHVEIYDCDNSENVPKNFCKDININTCICVLYAFGQQDNVIVVITLINKLSYTKQIVPCMKTLGTLLGILQNN